MGANLIYIAFIGSLPGLTYGRLDALDTARIGTAVSSVVATFLCVASWRFIRARPAAQKLPEGTKPTCCNMVLAGLKRLLYQARDLKRDYPQAGRFLLSYVGAT